MAIIHESSFYSSQFYIFIRVLLRSYLYDKHIFHYVCDRGIVFLCMCENEVTKKRIAYQFLDEIKAAWRAAYSEVENSAVAFAMQSEFSPILEKQMTHFSDNKASDNIGKLRVQIDSVKEVILSIYAATCLFACF